MPSILDFLARGRGALRRRTSPAPAKEPDHAAPDDPRVYAIELCRDEAALGRFIKRLSTLGAEDIQVDYAPGQAVRIRMKRPQTDTCWETIVQGLVKRCGLRPATFCQPPSDA